MALGFLMVGMAGGVLAGGAALILGQTIWMALAIYALTGITATMLGALAQMAPQHRVAQGAFADISPLGQA